MTITLRIIQRFDVRLEDEFMELEEKFAELEAERPDYPKGKRLQPISAGEPCNTLIWECEFPDIESAYGVLGFFHDDEAHKVLLEKQLPYLREVRTEFYESLQF